MKDNKGALAKRVEELEVQLKAADEDRLWLLRRIVILEDKLRRKECIDNGQQG